MSNVFSRAADRFLGRGDAAIAVPPMDGAFKPNTLVEEATRLVSIEAPDNLVRMKDSIFFSAGRKLLVAEKGWTSIDTIAECEGEILAVATGGDRLAIFDDAHGLSMFDPVTASLTRIDMQLLPPASVTAAAFQGGSKLVVCVGSSKNSAAEWQRDLLESEVAGSVWSVDIPSGTAKIIADGLAFPAGCLVVEDGRKALVSESWNNRLLLVDLHGDTKTIPVLTALPGYPSRLSPRSGAGAWLNLFAPRNPLVELVRREPGYRRAMMAEIPKEFWIAPALRSGSSFNEPMQGGALKQMGILKPWAPTRSYGLVVGLDERYSPVLSFHSRTDGRRHGLTSAVECDTSLIVSSKGAGEIISIAVEDVIDAA